MKTPDQRPDLSSTAVTAAIDAATAKRPDITDKYNGHFFEVRSNGKCEYKQGPCHGSMTGTGELIATMSPWESTRYGAYLSYAKDDYKRTINRDLLTRYYDWFVNRSWAADMIVAPSFEFARDVAFIVGTNEPANWVLAVMTMSRHCGEQAHNVARMFDYVDEFGVSEDLAFFLAFGCETANKYGSIMFGHNLFYQQGVGALERWMKRDIAKRNGPLREGGVKTGVNAMWGDRDKHIVAGFKPFEHRIEAGKVVIPNPFKPVAASRDVMTEDYLRSLIPNLKEKFDHASTTNVQLAA